MAAEPAAPPILRTMADLIAAPEPKWLAEALYLTGAVSVGLVVYRAIDGEIETRRERGSWPSWEWMRFARDIPIPIIPYPPDQLDHLQGVMSMINDPDAAYGSDFPWAIRDSACQIKRNGDTIALCSCMSTVDKLTITVVGMTDRTVALPNGQPARIWLGQCENCGTILYGP